MVRIAVVRHGEKQYTSGLPEEKWCLAPKARANVRQLRAALVKHGPLGLMLTSKWRHAVETATALADTSRNCPVVELVGLTPFTADVFFTKSSILGEVRDAGIALAGIHFTALVAHHDRTMQIVAALTRVQGTPEIRRLEALVMEATSLRSFLHGRGVVIDRFCAESD